MLHDHASSPEAPGEYRHPPRPAIDESIVLMPICSAVSTLEQPCPYVSCMCAASALTGIALAHSCMPSHLHEYVSNWHINTPHIDETRECCYSGTLGNTAVRPRGARWLYLEHCCDCCRCTYPICVPHGYLIAPKFHEPGRHICSSCRSYSPLCTDYPLLRAGAQGKIGLLSGPLYLRHLPRRSAASQNKN